MMHKFLSIEIVGASLAAVAITINPLFSAIGMLLLSAFLAFLAAWYWFQRNTVVKERDRIAEEHRKLVDRVTQIELQSHVLSQAMLPVTAAFQAILVKELTHYHTPEMDALLVKLGPPLTLTEEEAERLAVMLEQRTRDMGSEITASERDAALMMPAVMRRVRAEAALPALPPVRLIALTAVVESSSGARRAMLIGTEASTVERNEGRSVFMEALAENTRLTQETSELAREIVGRNQ